MTWLAERLLYTSLDELVTYEQGNAVRTRQNHDN